MCLSTAFEHCILYVMLIYASISVLGQNLFQPLQNFSISVDLKAPNSILENKIFQFLRRHSISPVCPAKFNVLI